VSYNDLSQAGVRERFPHVMERLQKGEVVLPAVYVDDEVVNLGYVDYFKIAKAIEQSRTGDKDNS
jgi:disulfide oxidoreductase YuzD